MHAYLSSRLVAASILTCTCIACDPAPEPVGRIAMALATTSDGGSVYRLPFGTFLRVEGAGFSDDLVLDGSDVVSSFEVPVGEYTATLTHPYGFEEDWVLTRGAALEQADVVIARLVSPRAVAIRIEAGQTTDVVFAFRVATGEVIAFERGGLAVSFGVEEVLADVAYLNPAALVDIVGVAVDPAAPSALASWWPVVGTEDVDLRFSGIVGPWAPRSSARACAELDVSARYLANSPALADLLAEASDGDAEVCVYSQAGQHWLEVAFARSGAAATETLAALGRPDYTFDATFWFELPAQVFDGATLDPLVLDDLVGPLPFTGEMRVGDGAGEWFSASLSGTSAFDFAPTLR